MSDKLICEACHGTGYYGDNGPGIKGNREYQPCDQCDARGFVVRDDKQTDILANLAALIDNWQGFVDESQSMRDTDIAYNPMYAQAIGECLDELRAVVEGGER